RTTRSIPGGSAVSACHTMAGSRPDTRFSVRAMSRSRLMPGKTMTAAFTDLQPMSFISTNQLHIVTFDHGVRQQLLRGLAEPRLGRSAVAVGDFDIEDLALAHAGDAIDAERLQRPLDRLSLGIEDAGFQPHSDLGFHGTAFRGSGLSCAALGKSNNRKPARPQSGRKDRFFWRECPNPREAPAPSARCCDKSPSPAAKGPASAARSPSSERIRRSAKFSSRATNASTAFWAIAM